jgi:putative DNA primase/helicase
MVGYEPNTNGRALSGPLLVVPIKRGGKLSTLQLIDGEGCKHFLAGGAISGGFWTTDSLPDNDGAGLTLLLGEGVATVLSAQQAMPSAIGVSALSGGNIRKVARQMRERFPQTDIVVLADVHKETGVPDKYAADAARDIGAKLAVPRFEGGPAPDRKDFNDLMRVQGFDAVLAALRASVIEASAPNAAPKPRGGGNTTVTLVRAADITPEPIDWLWDGYLARGKVHFLAGKPSAGKTTLAIIIAATVSTGGTWPDGSQCKKGRVVIWSGEDDPADTLVPRLIAAGADLERVELVKGATEDGEPVPFDPARHLPSLAQHLETAKDVALLIVDPVVSAVAGDSHKNTEVRRSLQPLVDLAEKTGCAVLGITHFTKGTGGKDPVERLTGSLAFGAVARVVLVAAKTMMRAKSNIGPDGGGFAYDLERRELPCVDGVIFASVVRWGAEVYGSARDVLAEAEAIDPDGASKLEDSADWLSDILAGGAVAASKVKAQAKAAGHAWKTVKRAKERLGVASQKEGMNGGWTWSLPRRDPKNTEEAQQNLLGPFDRVGPLRADDDADDIVEGAL